MPLWEIKAAQLLETVSGQKQKKTLETTQCAHDAGGERAVIRAPLATLAVQAPHADPKTEFGPGLEFGVLHPGAPPDPEDKRARSLLEAAKRPLGRLGDEYMLSRNAASSAAKAATAASSRLGYRVLTRSADSRSWGFGALGPFRSKDAKKRESLALW